MDHDTAQVGKRNPLLFRAVVPVIKGILAAYNGAMRGLSRDAAFFDAADFPWTKEVEACYPGIREECLRALSDLNKVPNLEDLGDAGSKKLAHGGAWKAVLLMIFGQYVPRNEAACPQTCAALRKIPGVKSALFSILAPGTHLARHEGPFAGVLRYHLGVLVPPGNACRIEVDDESRTWEEGKSMIFDDTHPHEVWNDSGQIRVVLFVDFVRPMPWLLQFTVHVLLGMARFTPIGRQMMRNANQAR